MTFRHSILSSGHRHVTADVPRLIGAFNKSTNITLKYLCNLANALEENANEMSLMRSGQYFILIGKQTTG